jgi:hypothetical protein
MNDILYWKNFCDTYDIQYLNFISRNGKDLLYKIITTKKVKFKGLKRIIELYFDESWKNLIECNYFGGLSTLSYHKLNNKKVYIFGESSYLDCDLIAKSENVKMCNGFNFLLNTIKNEPKFIDLFIDIDVLSPQTIKELTNVRIHNIADKSEIIEQLFTKYPKIKYQYSNEPENIIIFDNDKYSDYYRKELKELKFTASREGLKFKTINYTNNEKKNCIDISRFKLPLFSS